MSDGFRVEYSEDWNQVCIIPMPTVPAHDFAKIMKLYNTLGYKYWLPSDKRCGYILAKKVKNDIKNLCPRTTCMMDLGHV